MQKEFQDLTSAARIAQRKFCAIKLETLCSKVLGLQTAQIMENRGRSLVCACETAQQKRRESYLITHNQSAKTSAVSRSLSASRACRSDLGTIRSRRSRSRMASSSACDAASRTASSCCRGTIACTNLPRHSSLCRPLCTRCRSSASRAIKTKSKIRAVIRQRGKQAFDCQQLQSEEFCDTLKANDFTYFIL